MVPLTTAENIPATVIPASTLAFGTLTARTADEDERHHGD